MRSRGHARPSAPPPACSARFHRSLGAARGFAWLPPRALAAHPCDRPTPICTPISARASRVYCSVASTACCATRSPAGDRLDLPACSGTSNEHLVLASGSSRPSDRHRQLTSFRARRPGVPPARPRVPARTASRAASSAIVAAITPPWHRTSSPSSRDALEHAPSHRLRGPRSATACCGVAQAPPAGAVRLAAARRLYFALTVGVAVVAAFARRRAAGRSDEPLAIQLCGLCYAGDRRLSPWSRPFGRAGPPTPRRPVVRSGGARDSGRAIVAVVVVAVALLSASVALRRRRGGRADRVGSRRRRDYGLRASAALRGRRSATSRPSPRLDRPHLSRHCSCDGPVLILGWRRTRSSTRSPRARLPALTRGVPRLPAGGPANARLL